MLSSAWNKPAAIQFNRLQCLVTPVHSTRMALKAGTRADCRISVRPVLGSWSAVLQNLRLDRRIDAEAKTRNSSGPAQTVFSRSQRLDWRYFQRRAAVWFGTELYSSADIC